MEQYFIDELYSFILIYFHIEVPETIPGRILNGDGVVFQ
jgi:hypothetical protein